MIRSIQRKIKTIIRWIKKLWGMERKVKWIVVQTFFLSGIVRWLLLKIPFKKLQPYLGKYNEESSENKECKEYEEAKDISRVVELVSHHTPWESKCLVQAIVAQYLLKKKRISTTLYLGVCRDENGELKAHAWLRCGQITVTGERYKPGYKEVCKFSNENTLK